MQHILFCTDATHYIKRFLTICHKILSKLHMYELIFVSPSNWKKKSSKLSDIFLATEMWFYMGAWNWKCTECLVRVIHTDCAHLVGCQLCLWAVSQHGQQILWNHHLLYSFPHLLVDGRKFTGRAYMVCMLFGWAENSKYSDSHVEISEACNIWASYYCV